MNKKVVAIWLSLMMVLCFVVIVDVILDFTPTVRGSNTLYVNETGNGGAYLKIQDAINASNDGDSVYVYSGTYFENVIVNKTINLTGEDRNNTIIDGEGTGDVIFVSAIWVNITDFTITNGSDGLYLHSSSNNNKVTSNNVYSNNENGIRLLSSSNNNISGNDVYSNIENGIYLSSSSDNNKVIKNNISNNGKVGLRLSSSSNNNIRSNNVLSNNWSGVSFLSSSSNKVTSNNFVNDGIFIIGNQISHFNSHNISTDNIVNGKPLYYYKNCTGINIEGIPVGQLIFANCTDVNVKNLHINNTDVGIEVAYSTNTIIIGNNVSNNYHGIYLISSSNNTITNNIILNNLDGIELVLSSNNTLTNNNISFNLIFGARLHKSTYNNITCNNVSYNGIGIGLTYSSNNNITNNNFTNDGIFIQGNELSYYNSHNISTNNIVNGKPLYYYKDSDGINIDGVPMGQLILANCTNFNVRNIQINNTDVGIEIAYSTNIIIMNSTVLNNDFYGIYLDFSSNNNIYHNNFIDNSLYHYDVFNDVNQAYDSGNDNFWNDTYPSGGNFWSDYAGIDLNSTETQDVPPPDGIGDTPFVIDSDSQDNYPLMGPIGNCIFLNKGWNLISIPFIQSDTNLDSVLNSINGSYDAVQWYNISDNSDPWKHYKKGKPYGNDLSEINETMGFWIYITKPGGVLFQYFGNQPTDNQSITLYPGWNQVGYPSLSNKNRTAALNNITFGNDVDSIWTYKAATQKWEELGESDYFGIGKGYWIHSKVKKTWEVPL